jgi:hypothetical protein
MSGRFLPSTKHCVEVSQTVQNKAEICIHGSSIFLVMLLKQPIGSFTHTTRKNTDAKELPWAKET